MNTTVSARFSCLVAMGLFALAAQADDALTNEEIRQLVTRVNDAQNALMMEGSTAADVDALFALYTEDFTYVHEGYGGEYSREELHGNSVNNAEAGRYGFTQDRYRILEILPGHNAAAVQRLSSSDGQRHLSVFEFEDGKVSKIVEYWR